MHGRLVILSGLDITELIILLIFILLFYICMLCLSNVNILGGRVN